MTGMDVARLREDGSEVERLSTEEWKQIVTTAAMSHRDAVVINLRPVFEAILTAREAEHERVVRDLRACWKVDMRLANERGDALADREARLAMARALPELWDPPGWKARTSSGATLKRCADELRAALHPDPSEPAQGGGER